MKFNINSFDESSIAPGGNYDVIIIIATIIIIINTIHNLLIYSMIHYYFQFLNFSDYRY